LELAALLTIAEADVVTANPEVLPVMVVALMIFGAAINFSDHPKTSAMPVTRALVADGAAG
jgi:hypothetical protein